MRAVESTVNIYSSFAADSIEVPLNILLKYSNLHQTRIKWNQYACLSQKDFLYTETPLEGIHVLLVRVEDLLRPHPEIPVPTDDLLCQEILTQFKEGVELFATKVGDSPCILVICPPSSSIHDKMIEYELEYFNQTFISQNILYFGDALWNTYWPSFFHERENYYISRSDIVSHQPYSPTFLVLISYMISYFLYRSQVNSIKVIIVDCDNTLWGGVVGEVGCSEVEYLSHHQHLQKFLVSQWKSGVLIALCSKNEEFDVIETFSARKDFHIDFNENIVCHRCNWSPKSRNVLSILHELGISPENAIFIDDNGLECMEVQNAIPEIRVLHFPASINVKVSNNFLFHCWEICSPIIQNRKSLEDTTRTKMYKESSDRNAYLKSIGLVQMPGTESSAILKALEIKVDIEHFHCTEIPSVLLNRLSQLTQRTNQFNMNKKHFSVNEIKYLLTRPEYDLLSITVTDRFGHYGVVGMCIISSNDKTTIVEQFMVSCRVLYRRVEHHMLHRIAEISHTKGCDKITMAWKRSKRNRPALYFLWSLPNSIFSQTVQGTEVFDYQEEAGKYENSIEHFNETNEPEFDEFLSSILLGSSGTSTFSVNVGHSALDSNFGHRSRTPNARHTWKAFIHLLKPFSAIGVLLFIILVPTEMFTILLSMLGICLLGIFIYSLPYFYNVGTSELDRFSISGQSRRNVFSDPETLHDVVSQHAETSGTPWIPQIGNHKGHQSEYAEFWNEISWSEDIDMNSRQMYQENCKFRRKVRHKAKSILLDSIQTNI